MVPAAPWPWVSSQTSRPDVAHAGVATWPVRAAAPGAAMAAAGTRAAVQANAPAMKNRRTAVVRRFMTYSFAQEGQPGDSRDLRVVFARAEADPHQLIHHVPPATPGARSGGPGDGRTACE